MNACVLRGLGSYESRVVDQYYPQQALQALIKSLWRELESCNCSLSVIEGYSLINNSVFDYKCNAVYRMISRTNRCANPVQSAGIKSRTDLIRDLANKAGIPVISLVLSWKASIGNNK